MVDCKAPSCPSAKARDRKVSQQPCFSITQYVKHVIRAGKTCVTLSEEQLMHVTGTKLLLMN